MRPLDFLGSIKLKLGVVILAAVAVTVVVVSLGERTGLSPVVAGVGAALLALAMVQVLAHGMTFPLREMVVAARAMARGDYSRSVTSTSRDEVGELARAFNTMAGELAEVDRMRRDLVANVSHELRTPIGALRATLENLVDEVEPAAPAVLESMLRQTERLGKLAEQLLQLSKLEAGAVPLERRHLPLRTLLLDVADEWRTEAERRDVCFSVRVQPPNLALHADGDRIRQVLDNLVANAVRHSPVGGTIALSAAAHDGHVQVEVTDEGTGIPPSEAGRVFERFYRSDQARSPSEGGSGLGLAIVRGLVDLHGGTIRVEQAVPTGCRMIVDLPR
ncbi:MAG TPA: ATP-binding protein [Actinomycetota bacterium]|nr:ATP-binding protein [Actinomycetota bacterium]